MMHERLGPKPTTLDELDAISRTRPLTASEERRLRWALNRKLGAKGAIKPWTRGDIRRLKAYLVRGKRPAQIGPLMGRTERAIWRKMYKLGWTVGTVAQGSIDPARRK